MFISNRLITPTSMVSIWWNNISKISNVTMKSKMVVTTLAQGKQKVTHLTLFLDCILNHNIKWNNLDKCTSNHVSTEKIISKPNLHFHDFSRCRHSISAIFSLNLFNTAIGMRIVTLFTKFHVKSLYITMDMSFWNI